MILNRKYFSTDPNEFLVKISPTRDAGEWKHWGSSRVGPQTQDGFPVYVSRTEMERKDWQSVFNGAAMAPASEFRGKVLDEAMANVFDPLTGKSWRYKHFDLRGPKR